MKQALVVSDRALVVAHRRLERTRASLALERAKVAELQPKADAYECERAKAVELRPKAAAFDRLASAEGCMLITDAAKELGV